MYKKRILWRLCNLFRKTLKIDSNTLLEMDGVVLVD